MRPLFAILPFLMTAATDPATPGAPPTTPGADTPLAPAEALKKVEDGTIPFSQRLKIAADALRGIGPTDQFAAVQQQLTTANETLAARDQEITRLNGLLTTANTNVADLEARNVTLETEAKELRSKEQDIQKRATALGKETIAALGFPAAQLPAASEEATGASSDEQIAALQKKMEATTDPKEKGRLAQQVWDLATGGQGKN